MLTKTFTPQCANATVQFYTLGHTLDDSLGHWFSLSVACTYLCFLSDHLNTSFTSTAFIQSSAQYKLIQIYSLLRKSLVCSDKIQKLWFRCFTYTIAWCHCNQNFCQLPFPPSSIIYSYWKTKATFTTVGKAETLEYLGHRKNSQKKTYHESKFTHSLVSSIHSADITWS